MKDICICKRAYINALSGICAFCWNEKYPDEQEIIDYNDLLESKEETVEDAAERLWLDSTSQLTSKNSFIQGAKWQSQRMYTEEDLEEAFENGVGSGKYQQEYGMHARGYMTFQEWFEQFKKI